MDRGLRTRWARRWGFAAMGALLMLALAAGLTGGPAHASGDGETDDVTVEEGDKPKERFYVKDLRIGDSDGFRFTLFQCIGREQSSSIVWECSDGRDTSWVQETDLQDEPTIADYDCHFKNKDDCNGVPVADPGETQPDPANGSDPSVLIVETLTETQYWYAVTWGMAYYQAERQAYVYDPYYGRLVPTDDPWGGRTLSSDDPYAR